MARRQGVSETDGAQVGFAKCLITRPGIVPTSYTGVLASFPLPGVSSRTSPIITASPSCPWTLLSRPGRRPSLGTTHHSKVPTGFAFPQSGFQGDATHRDLMSVGLAAPQIAAQWPLPKPPRHFCCGWKGRVGRREAEWDSPLCELPGLFYLLWSPATRRSAFSFTYSFPRSAPRVQPASCEPLVRAVSKAWGLPAIPGAVGGWGGC